MLELLGAALTVVISYEVSKASGMLTVFFIGVVLGVVYIAFRGK
jgi:cbb3-type cytochrome oxidase subunit 3